jgi:hypothetical protein
MTFQLSSRKRLVVGKQMKILIFMFVVAALLLAFIFVLPEVSIIFFSPIIFAIAFISLSRELNRKKT